MFCYPGTRVSLLNFVALKSYMFSVYTSVVRSRCKPQEGEISEDTRCTNALHKQPTNGVGAGGASRGQTPQFPVQHKHPLYSGRYWYLYGAYVVPTQVYTPTYTAFYYAYSMDLMPTLECCSDQMHLGYLLPLWPFAVTLFASMQVALQIVRTYIELCNRHFAPQIYRKY